MKFHVDKYWVEGKNKELSNIGYDIVIHNVDDSTQVIANLCSDGECNLLTPQWAKYVCSRDFDVAFYRNLSDASTESQFYDELTCNTLQYGIDYFSMYYPTYSEWCMVNLPEKTSHCKLMADGSLRIKTTVTQKHCYAEPMQTLTDSLGLADNVYYAKGLTRVLSIDFHRAILIGADHKTIAAYPAGADFDKWLHKILKKK